MFNCNVAHRWWVQPRTWRSQRTSSGTWYPGSPQLKQRIFFIKGTVLTQMFIQRHPLHKRNWRGYQWPEILKWFKTALFKGSLTRDFRLQVFFRNQCPPGFWVSHWDHFEFFRKFAEIFANECSSAVSTTPAKKAKNFEIKFFKIFC